MNEKKGIDKFLHNLGYICGAACVVLLALCIMAVLVVLTAKLILLLI